MASLRLTDEIPMLWITPPPARRRNSGVYHMPPKATPASVADAESTAVETAQRISADAQKAISEATRRIEAAVSKGLEQVRSQSRVYAEAAGDQLDETARMASDQIRARPLVTTGAALGIGVLIGLLLAPRR